MHSSQTLEKHVRKELQEYESVVAEFQRTITDNPFRALEWGNGYLSKIARFDALKQVLAMIEELNGKNEPIVTGCWLQVKHRLMDLVVQGAKYPERSSDPMANLMLTYRVSAYAKILSEMRNSREAKLEQLSKEAVK